MSSLMVGEKFQGNNALRAALGAGVAGAGIGATTALLTKVTEDEFARTAMNVIDKKVADYVGLKRGFLNAPKEGNVVTPMVDNALRQLYNGKSAGEILTSKMSKENIDAFAKFAKANICSPRLTKKEKAILEKVRNQSFTPDDFAQAVRIETKIKDRIIKKSLAAEKAIYENLFGKDKKFVGKRDCQKIIAKLRKLDPEPIIQKYNLINNETINLVKKDTAKDIVKKCADACSKHVDNFKGYIFKLAKLQKAGKLALVCGGIAAGVAGVAALIFGAKKS